jgi:hypothetical protein
MHLNLPAAPQVSLEESAYRRQLPELQARLAAAGVRGVWEDRLPPELNAALALGCVAVVAPSARQRSLGAGFHLQELHMKPVAQVGGWVAQMKGGKEAALQ